MLEALIIFPHQLFESNASLALNKAVFVVEDALFFGQYPFHKQKLVLHRASMQAHADHLRRHARQVDYLDAAAAPTMSAVVQRIARSCRQIHYLDPVDDWLKRRLAREATAHDCRLILHPTELFLTDIQTLRPHFEGSHPLMATFYAAQRKRLGVLMTRGRPEGGKWSFDSENRQRLPANVTLPPAPNAPVNQYVAAARNYVQEHFATNPGSIEAVTYPVTAADARKWLERFLEERLAQFGTYEDAISAKESALFHSVLTPMLNIGILTPAEVVEATLAHAQTHDVPLNSLEGFVRQVIGWREFVRGTYEFHGRAQRSSNHWGHHRPIPPSFWTATTGIDPIDTVIARVLKTGYAHHIERLMILGNFMLLCEFAPDEVYRWFMEMFVDAYDWVMVPNVYGMGLHADGGRMMTKPYISGSNYILRMSDFRRGPWSGIWDGLFWRFIDKHRDFFSSNHRLVVMVRNLERMGKSKLEEHIATAQNFLARCDAQKAQR